MRLTREKVVHLSHVLADFLDREETTELTTDKNELRLVIVRLITDELKRDERIDRDVRRQVSSMKNSPPEGSPEWDAVYYRMYNEAMEKGQR